MNRQHHQTRILIGGLVVAAGLLTGCASAPSHPTLKSQQLTDLLPVREFVANTDYVDAFTLSRNGTKMAYKGVSQLRPALLWRQLDSDKVFAKRFRKYAPWPMWSPTSRYLLYHYDASGRENTQIFAIDTETADSAAVSITDDPSVKSHVLKIPMSSDNDVIYLTNNQRDDAWFDVFAYDLVSGEKKLIYANTEQITSYAIGDAGTIRARVRQDDTHNTLELLSKTGAFTPAIKALRRDWLGIHGLSADNKTLYTTTNEGFDKRTLIAIDVESGDMRTIFEPDTVDVGRIAYSPKDGRPLMARTMPDRDRAHFFDKALERALKPLTRRGRHGIGLMSIDHAEKNATVVRFDNSGADFLLVDLVTGKSKTLGTSASRKHTEQWVEKKPIQFKATDGRVIHGYLSLPKNAGDKALPTVLHVHGGPWARDRWGFQTNVQFLANRGYAVLQINYRGSYGYGRDHLYAAVGEFAGLMHQDLIDGLDWAIDRGYTDPDQVAIMGGSYGGYATLVGMTMTPDRFRCGIDTVGVSDLATLLEDTPAYWKSSLPLWHHFVGDPANPEDRKRMDAKSPLNYAEDMQGRLLIVHGRNDPRVLVNQSDRMYQALKAANKDVQYFVINDEGHGFRHWKNQMKYLRKIEDFLADCIGGRSSGFDFYQLGSWAF